MSKSTMELSMDGSNCESGAKQAVAAVKKISEAAAEESKKAAETMRVQAAATGMIRRERELLAAQKKLVASAMAEDAANAKILAAKQEELRLAGVQARAAQQKLLAAKQEELRLAGVQARAAQQNLQQTENQGAAAVRISKLQTQMAALRAAGNHKAADEVQREIALHHELAQIMQSNATSAQRVVLRQQALQRHSMGPGGGGSPNGANQRMANVSAQIQDIAVQTQMGASIGTIVSQQGGQLISALGGSSAMALGAGVATVAAAVVSLGVAGNESFAKLIKGSQDFGKELRNITAGGSLEQITSMVSESVDQINVLKDTQKGFDQSEKGYWAAFTANMRTNWANLRNFSTSGAQKELDAAGEEEFQLQLGVNAAVTEAISLSKKEVYIAQIRAKGMNEEADAMQRKLDLSRAIAKIDSTTDIPDRLKVVLKDALRDKDKSTSDGIEKKKSDDIRDHELKQKNDFLEWRETQEEKLRDFEKKQVDDFHDHEKKIAEDEAKDAKFLANFEYQAMTEFYDEEDKRIADIKKQKEEQFQNEQRAADALKDAQDYAVRSQVQRLSISQQISIATDKLAKDEQKAAQAQKFGTKEIQDATAAKALQSRLTLQELAMQRAAQFVGKSSADIRKADRDEAKQKRELDKAGKRMIEADIRKKDAEVRKSKFGSTGLTEAEKNAMRQAGNKALGKDILQDTAKESAASLKTIVENTAPLKDLKAA